MPLSAKNQPQNPRSRQTYCLSSVCDKPPPRTCHVYLLSLIYDLTGARYFLKGAYRHTHLTQEKCAAKTHVALNGIFFAMSWLYCVFGTPLLSICCCKKEKQMGLVNNLPKSLVNDSMIFLSKF